MSTRINRMFRVHLMDAEGEPTCRGTLSWLTGEGDSLVWVPDGGEREDIHNNIQIKLFYSPPKDLTETRGEDIEADGRVWRIYNELPVTAPTVHMTVAAVKEPVRAVVAAARPPKE